MIGGERKVKGEEERERAREDKRKEQQSLVLVLPEVSALECAPGISCMDNSGIKASITDI